jgi:hypothetical protein
MLGFAKGEGRGAARRLAAGAAVLALMAAGTAEARQSAMSLIHDGHAAFNAAVDADTKARADDAAGRHADACYGFNKAIEGIAEAERLLREAETQMDGDGARKVISEINDIHASAADERSNASIACQAAQDAGQMK